MTWVVYFIKTTNSYLVAPTETGPQEWGVGGEVHLWSSADMGENWVVEKKSPKKVLLITPM